MTVVAGYNICSANGYAASPVHSDQLSVVLFALAMPAVVHDVGPAALHLPVWLLLIPAASGLHWL